MSNTTILGLCLALIGGLLPAGASAATENGMFAVFETNHGNFTCELFHDSVPVTVANFVGLAEGSRGWLNLETGRVEHRPFYDGLTFHRVISGFMIQSGSPNGQGTDGPGYRFPDEFHPDLVHGKKGILSMANAGIDTNGSQFFITLGETSWLNYKHAVFGEIVDGIEVVEAIGAVDTGDDESPDDAVVIHSVEILRNGAAAESFDVNGHGLPVVRTTSSQIEKTEGRLAVRFGRAAGQDYTLSYSSDLKSWSLADLAPSGEEAGIFDVEELAGDSKQQFYQVAEIDNSQVAEAYVPETVVGKTLELDMISTGWHIVLRPEGTDDNADEWLGSGDFDDQTDLPLDHFWFREKSRGVLLFMLEGLAQFDLELLFRDEGSGTFTGIVRNGNEPPPTVNGVFTFRDREDEASVAD